MNTHIKKLAERYDEALQNFKESKCHADFFVVVPNGGASSSPSLFVETCPGGNYRIASGVKAYHYIYPTALNVCKILEKRTGKSFSIVKLTDWYKQVVEFLLPYKGLSLKEA